MQMILYYIQSFLLSYRTLTNPMVVSAPKLFFFKACRWYLGNTRIITMEREPPFKYLDIQFDKQHYFQYFKHSPASSESQKYIGICVNF